MINLIVHGRLGVLGRTAPPNSPLVTALVMAEALAPGDENLMFAGHDASLAQLRDIALWLTRPERLVTYSTGSRALFAEIEGNAAQMWDNPEGEGLISVLDYLAQTAQPAYMSRGVTIITNVVVAVTKRGHLTEAAKTKIQNGMKDDLNIDWNVMDEALVLFFKHFGGPITDATIEGYVRQWLDLIPQVALRLRLCLQQVAGSGITAYLTIGRAMVSYPDFPWHRIAVIMDRDWANYRLALETSRRA